MPILTEEQHRTRNRKLWGVWAALGVLLTLAGLLILPVATAISLPVGDRQYFATAGDLINGTDGRLLGELKEAIYPQGFSYCAPEHRYQSWTFRVGNFNYSVDCMRI